MYDVQLFAKCVASYFGQLISFPSESNSLDSEQSLNSEEEKRLPSSKSGESVAHVVKPSRSCRRSETSIDFCDDDSVLKLFGSSEIVHSYYTCNKNRCFSLTEREQKKNSALKRDRFKHQWISDHNLAFDSHTGMWWVIYKEESDDEKGGMFCLLCKKHNTANLKNSIPAQRLKTDALKDHAKNAQHAAVSIFQNAFMVVYWLAKEEMANKKFLSLLTLLQMLGLENMKHFRHHSVRSTI